MCDAMKRWLVAVALAGGLAAPGTAAGAGLADLPIGHVKIEEFDDGLINVQARCVSTSDLIRQVAAFTGLPVEFTKPLLTYVSMWNPERKARPADWLNSICMTGGYLVCKQEEACWRVSAVGTRRYDASATEAEIRKSYTRPRPAQAKSEAASLGGCVIHDGHMLSPPYEVTVGSAENDSCFVAVNGVVVERIGGRPKTTPRKVPDLPLSGQFDNEDDLALYLTCRLYPALVAEMEPEEAHQQLVRFAQTQDIIEKIVDPEDPYILVKYRHRPDPEPLMPANYRTPRAQAPAYSALDAAETVARGLERSLGTGCVVIIAGGVQMSGGGDFVLELQRCFATARNLPLRQAECVIRDSLIGQDVARRLAVNLSPYYGELDVRLGALAPVRQPESPPPPLSDKELDALAVDMLEE